MSHMWFGDLVTMKWWDDLWLNESFAEYMSHRCLVDATEYTDAGSTPRSCARSGATAPSGRRRPTRWPGWRPSTRRARCRTSTESLRQGRGGAARLIAYVGDEAFIAGGAPTSPTSPMATARSPTSSARSRRASGMDLARVVARGCYGRPGHAVGGARCRGGRRRRSARRAARRRRPPGLNGHTRSTSRGGPTDEELSGRRRSPGRGPDPRRAGGPAGPRSSCPTRGT